MNRVIGLILLCGITFTYINAQDAGRSIEQIIADIFDQYSAESEEEIDFESFSEELQFLSDRPINLNKADRETLEKLIFLNDIQIENILFYIYSNQKLQSIYELQLIEGLDMTDIRRMLPFVFVGKGELPPSKINKFDLIKYGRSDLLFRMDIFPEEKKGFIVQDKATNSKPVYTGQPIYNYVKYKYHYRDRIYAGITLENDAGEKFYSKERLLYDFKSFHVQLNDFANFKTIVLGDYKAVFGQGLVLNTNFGMGKSSIVLNINKRNQGLQKYSSSNEFNFFRGVGASYRFKKIETSLFYSNKYVDADTTGAVITGFYTTGLHRTSKEIDKRHTVSQQVFGMNSSFSNNYFQVAATVVHTLLNFPIEPAPAVYNFHSFNGNKQTTASLNYRFRLYKFYFSGETAIDQDIDAATLNSLSFSPHSLVSMAILHRYYSSGYSSFYANAFGESSQISNENGLYFGLELRPYKKWKLSAYFDSYTFPWPKYLIDAPTHGKDYFFQADYSQNRNMTMFWRVKFEEKEITQKLDDVALARTTTSSKFAAKYQLNFRVENFDFKTVVDLHLYRKLPGNYRNGFSVLQDISYRFQSIPLSVDLRYQFFDAEDYDNRFYSYEKDILYAFSIPMYYGLGSRSYVNVKYVLNDNLSFWLKLAQTIYADGRETIGTGNDEIIGNKRTDIRFLLKFNF